MNIEKREKYVSRWLKRKTKYWLDPTEEELGIMKQWLYWLYDRGNRDDYPLYMYQRPKEIEKNIDEVYDNHSLDKLRIEIRVLCNKYSKEEVRLICEEECKGEAKW